MSNGPTNTHRLQQTSIILVQKGCRGIWESGHIAHHHRFVVQMIMVPFLTTYCWHRTFRDFSFSLLCFSWSPIWAFPVPILLYWPTWSDRGVSPYRYPYSRYNQFGFKLKKTFFYPKIVPFGKPTLHFVLYLGENVRARCNCRTQTILISICIYLHSHNRSALATLLSNP